VGTNSSGWLEPDRAIVKDWTNQKKTDDRPERRSGNVIAIGSPGDGVGSAVLGQAAFILQREGADELLPGRACTFVWNVWKEVLN
jgi:hypothetical protein